MKKNNSSNLTAINVHDGMWTGTILRMCHVGKHNCNESMSSVVICCSGVNTPLQSYVYILFASSFSVSPVFWEMGATGVLFRAEQPAVVWSQRFDQYGVSTSTIIYCRWKLL